jgi:LacI family transcriptional regulator
MKESSDRRPTIRDVAKRAHVGLMTVSRVINNHPSVRPGTLKKVHAAIAELGYQQNEAARLLKGLRAKLIGLIVPDLSDAFFASCAHTVQSIARAHGYMTLIVASNRDSDLEIQQAELMASRRISGLLVVTSTTGGDDRLKKVQDAGLPIVALDRPLSGMKTDAVVVENRLGAEEAVHHLLKHGHRHIACVGYGQGVYTVRERIDGYFSCMREANLEPSTAFGLETLESTQKWLTKALKANEPPTAIFSLNHRTSLFLLQSLAKAKIALPQGMALIGFDDFDFASVVSPPVTTVAQSPVELAGRAMALLIDKIERHGKGTEFAPAKIVLPATLTIRASCGCTENSRV